MQPPTSPLLRRAREGSASEQIPGCTLQLDDGMQGEEQLRRTAGGETKSYNNLTQFFKTV